MNYLLSLKIICNKSTKEGVIHVMLPLISGGDNEKDDEIDEYAEQWNVSSKYFYDQGYYTWMVKETYRI